ncbi:MAG: MFS transporter [Rickettsiales bacterium]
MAFLGGKEKRKVIISGMLGNGLEWYDYALYGHMSIIFSKLFFAPGDDSQNLIFTFLIFGVGFIFRPLGAILFGRLGDKYGRKKALTASMILMAIPTGFMGLLPTYEMIGIGAPIMLVLIRILQGLSLGGAYSGSISYVVEHAPPEQRSSVGSVIKLSLVIGFLMGSLVSTLTSSLMSTEDFYSWGWRVPFFLGLGIGFVGFYIKNHGEESPVYEQAKKDGALSANPLRDTFTKYPTKMVRAFMIYIFVTVPFYIVATYMIAYSKQHLGLKEEQALLINSIAMASMFITIFPAARLADKYGRKAILLIPIVAMTLLAYPLFQYIQAGMITEMVTDPKTGKEVIHFIQAASFSHVLIANIVMAMILGWYLGPIPAVLVEIFPTNIRYTGMSLAYNLCAICGGFIPAIAESLIKNTGSSLSIQWLLMGAGAVSFVAVLTYKDRWRDPLPEK